MAKYTHDVIIIGGGAAGLTATSGCAQLGLKTALIEKARLGGDCLFHGCVPSKTFLKIATVFQQTRQFAQYGLPQVALPSPDMQAINRRIARVIDHIAAHDSPERFEALGAEIFFGDSKFLSPRSLSFTDAKEGKQSTLSAPRIILALGSSPRGIPVPGLEEAGYITNIEVFSLPTRPDTLTIIGAGPIGIEMSQVFSRLGTKVTLIDIAEQVLINDDADVAEIVATRLEVEGVQLRLGVTIVRVEPKGAQGKKQVILRGDEGEEVIMSDEIMVAAGRQGNTAGLDLENAGVKVEKTFIPTNSKLQTSQSHILAIGDCNGRMLFTHTAGAEGSVAVRRVALRAGGTMNYRTVPWVTYTDPELASIGYNEKRAIQDHITYDVISEKFQVNDRALAENAPEGMMKLLINQSQKVIGAQIVGLHAGDILLPAIFAVGEGWGVKRLMNPMYPYPTLGELYKKSVGGFMSPKLFNNKVRGILRFLHHYRGKTKR